MSVRECIIGGSTIEIHPEAASACRAAARKIAQVMNDARSLRGKAVLGLATGNTPIRVYEHLVQMHLEGNLSFDEVCTYNLDEYYPMSPFDPNSYRRYMQTRLLEAVGIEPNNAHVFDATVPEAFANASAAQYDQWIAAEGGLDLQLLGIGRNGHIGFNEPMDLSVEDALKLGSRLVELHPITKEDATVDFGSIVAVPDRALTLGLAPIFAARSILVLAFGAKKAEIVARAIHGPLTTSVPASLLRTAGNRVTWVIDEEAAAQLKAE